MTAYRGQHRAGRPLRLRAWWWTCAAAWARRYAERPRVTPEQAARARRTAAGADAIAERARRGQR